MPKTISLVQGSEEWHEYRRTHIGSSDANIIMGFGYTDLEGLYNQKVYDMKVEDNWAMRRGREYEPIIRELFEKETGYIVFPQVIEHEDYSWMSASFDGLSLCGRYACELKYNGKETHEMALKGLIPPKHYAQLQHQMFVANISFMYYVSYDGKSHKTVICHRDQEFIVNMIDKELMFWKGVEGKSFKVQTLPVELSVANALVHAIEMRTYWEKEEKELKKKITSLKIEGKIGKLFVSKSTKAGKIRYDEIPELNTVDLEKYRDPEQEVWTIRIRKSIDENSL